MNNPWRKAMGLIALKAMLMGGKEWDDPTLVPPKPSKPVKKCIRCSKEHSHNNSFCSAECAKLWKEEKHNEPRNSK